MPPERRGRTGLFGRFRPHAVIPRIVRQRRSPQGQSPATGPPAPARRVVCRGSRHRRRGPAGARHANGPHRSHYRSRRPGEPASRPGGPRLDPPRRGTCGLGGSGSRHPPGGRGQVHGGREVDARPVRRGPDRRPGRPAGMRPGGIRELHLRSHLGRLGAGGAAGSDRQQVGPGLAHHDRRRDRPGRADPAADRSGRGALA